MNFYKRNLKTIYAATAVFFISAFLLAIPSSVKASYNPAYLIRDDLFTASGSMSANSIQSFLVGKNSYLANYRVVENCGSPSGAHYSYYATYYSCGSSVLASKAIYDAGRAYGISPKAILATLQKEQSLVTDSTPTSSQLDYAMGYGCPSSCDPAYKGFFSQVDNGAWQFRTYIELMNGRNYWGYGPSSYPCKNATSLYSTGLYPGRSVRFANPGGVAKTITLANSATAGLYCYTPFVGPYSETGYSGSYNFVISYEAWFGSTIGYHAYQLVSAQYPPGIYPGDAYKIVIKLRNTGTETWYSDSDRFNPNNIGGHPIRLATSGYANSPYAYPGIGGGWLTRNQIRMVQNSVAPGAIGTFEAVIYAPYQQLNFAHNFRLVLDGVKFIGGPAMPVAVHTPAPVGSYRIISKTNLSTLRSRQTATVTVVLRNTGNMIWRNIHRKVPGSSTQYPLRDVRMMTWGPPYHTSAFWAGTPEWLGTKNQITPVTRIVGPGKDATYTITFKAPPVSKTTYYNEQFNLVLDGQMVLPFIALTFPVTVTP